MKETKLRNEDKSLLGDLLLNQKYALELVSNELADLENGQKQENEARMKELNELYDRLVKAGY